MSYVQSYFHIVFSTKERRRVLVGEDAKVSMYKYIWGFIKENKCHLYRVNSVEDHLHMLVGLHQTVALADFVRDLKTSTNSWLKREKLFKGFDGWQPEYGAFSTSHEHRDAVIEYIKSQQEHHRHVDFLEEFKALLQREGIRFESRYVC